ncbi:hypothetical protein GWK47_018703 [Chionoecetes opilio]|uniref:Uncharacterized protein n=1 Tax=Chionoecetes opilio TaxID=41210 RepID=A0A8J4XQW7_CHIOP|nr:hypothetical protein GWK47_018703 [Chionoecetes opilio]
MKAACVTWSVCLAPARPQVNGGILARRGLKTIIEDSKEKGDGIHLDIEAKLATEPPQQLRCHASCAASYTSKDHRGRKPTKKQKSDENDLPVKRRRSQVTTFNFKQYCLLCGEDCLGECLPIDHRHPDRWHKVCQCETVTRSGQLTFKHHILDTGESRGDAWAQDISPRLAGPVDLPTADAQYYLRCYNKYRKPLAKLPDCVPLISDPALPNVGNEMNDLSTI